MKGKSMNIFPYVREMFHVLFMVLWGKKTMNNFPYYRETFHGSAGNLKGPNISW
jgi:hypothetical protein